MIGFHTDLTPDENWPRVRFDFTNGWTASLIVRVGRNSMDGPIAALACWPTEGFKPGNGRTEIGPQEAFPDEVALYLAAVAARRVESPL